MTAKARDYSILDKLNLERKPVGVKFLPVQPEGIPRITKRLSFCEMFKEAQTSPPFYVQKEDLFCIEPFILGMEEPDPMLVGGLVGEADELFEEARANRKLYQFLPKMVKGSVGYVAFSSVDQLTFDPDVVVFTANAGQAYHILRALNFSSGDMWSAKGTSVAACAWIYIYPVISGEMNLTITGISLGMRALKVFPEGLVIISIPWPKLDQTLKNMRNMKWKLLSDEITGEEHKKRVDKLFNDLRQKIKNS
ncbi:MAG: hypothetical protein E3J92_00675 [Dehalococcoidia bacterium]|nr:MAG: hypothetical protein E3J92_00675 [Dehalococcoidia bacterium]